MSTSSTRNAVSALPTGYREPLVQSSIPPSKQEREVDNRYLAGDVIADRYRLVKKLGEGGMGVVWVAHSLVLGVDIALKLISASAAGRSVATRMAREAHAAARLGHPALVRVFDFGWTTRGDPFLVMELAQGETLAKLLGRENRLGAVRAVQLLLPICDGIRCAHEKGIVHRDIKPENVFIAADAFGRLQPKLLDFGIAKMDQLPADSRLTQVGAVLGSPEFMSPEQARGDQDIDLRTDVWSTAVMLYEMITGLLPFTHTNYNALMQAILHEEPAPTTNYGAGDADLWRVIGKGLAKQRDQRWESMTEFGEALALWLYEHGVKEDVCGNSVRALWLDGALSGVRPEIITDAPGDGPNLHGSTVATVITRPTPLQVIKTKANQWRKLAARRTGSLALAGLGLMLGIFLTLMIVSPERASDARPESASEPNNASHAVLEQQHERAPAVRAAPAEAAVREPSAPATKVSELPTAAEAPATSAQADRQPEPSRPKARAPSTKAATQPRPRAQPRSIRDFGF